jgi:phage terminase large subunit-like protein
VARRKRPVDDQITAADVIAFIEQVCFIPEGKYVGKPLKLYEWQKRDLERIYDNSVGTRRAILSMPRKQGKTALSACLLLAHLCGPHAKHRPNSQLYSAAQSRDQAAIIFALASKMVRLNPELARTITIRESAKELFCPELGTRYKALSAEATTAYGLSPSFVIFDELGQVRGPRSPLYEALETATGAQENPLTIIISTQAPTDADLLSILIDDAKAGNDLHTVLSLYTAPPELDPFAEDTVKLANPAFGTFLNPREVLAMAADAKRMPAREIEFRNLILNQRIEVNNPFIAPAVWSACGTPVAPLEGVPVYGGLDLSATMDLTALVLIGYCDRKWHVHPTFWLPSEGLSEKAVADRVPYDLWHGRGHSPGYPGQDRLLRVRRASAARSVPALPCSENRIRPLEHEALQAVAHAGRLQRAMDRGALRRVRPRCTIDVTGAARLGASVARRSACARESSNPLDVRQQHHSHARRRW